MLPLSVKKIVFSLFVLPIFPFAIDLSTPDLTSHECPATLDCSSRQEWLAFVPERFVHPSTLPQATTNAKPVILAGMRLHGTAASGCAMTGTFDLSNTCNNIYLLTGTIR